ncbi:hypothetical protein B0G85_1874 [Polynucleobacter brandtiae]|uniref:Uncharacterized protein n=2 Tax=Polynucleobacter brandtiae TaxID=1938816 RepID=A0A2M8VJ58_9BURK|nr:hypothetical protein B0G85_1874 [Polynucleobacter brandtiae]
MLGTITFLMVLLFLGTSLATQFFYSQEDILQTKILILESMPYFLITLVSAGILGLFLSRGRVEVVIADKKKRMLFILLICTLMLWPLAYFLDQFARNHSFNLAYDAMQSTEYGLDLIILTLLGLNFRDGAKLVAHEA